MLSSFKGKTDIAVVFPTAVMYVREAANSSSSGSSSSGGSSSSLSGGDIAGIVVGSVAAAAALAGCAWLLLVRRQRQQQQASPKGAEEAASKKGELGTCGSWGSAAGRGPGSTALESAGSGSRQASLNGLALGVAIPELAEHVAVQEAALTATSLSPQASGSWDDSMLPPHLLASVVDASQIVPLRRPDGSLWQIGSGASSKVFRVEYRGEVRSCCAALCRAALPCPALEGPRCTRVVSSSSVAVRAS